jgi:hypothetical protein
LNPGPPDPIVVDNFYGNPDEVREFAVSCKYWDSPFISTDSLVSRERHSHTEDTLHRIARLVGTVPNMAEINSLRSFWGFGGCGEFQLRTETHGVGRVHSHTTGEWTGIVYLSQDCPDSSIHGTRFHRHLPTGLYHFGQFNNNDYEVIKKECRQFDKWELLLALPFVFNRLVLFDSRYLHSEAAGYGWGPADGRLIQIFNFRSVQANTSSE